MFGFSNADVPAVDASFVMNAINKKEDFILLDVRSPEEVSAGKIAGSINVPVNTISKDIEKALPDKNKTIYVYCRSGVRSTSSVSTMVKMGYKNVFNVIGGLLSWQEKNYPVV